jgi:hypothetical protein
MLLGSRQLEDRRQPVAALHQVAPHLPEPPQRGRQPQGGLDLAGALGPGQRGPEVVVLGGHRVEPRGPVLTEQERRGPTGQGQEMLGVPTGHLVGLRRLGQKLLGELPDRLQHEEAGLAGR